MDDRRISNSALTSFRAELVNQEKSTATVEKYCRDVRYFALYIGDNSVSKETVMAFKQHLLKSEYAARSVNSMLASVNSFLTYMGWADSRVKSLRLQKKVYCAEEKELTKEEYFRLLRAAGNDQVKLILQTICSTGIRVSELKFFTVEALRQGEIVVDCKNKTRNILVPGKLRKMLLNYAKETDIKSGALFLGKTGKPLDRSRVWAIMKSLCGKAGVLASKVFPHNLRKLFARTFYSVEKDIAKLADILGHSSINTTRIYIISTGREHRKKIEQLGLLFEVKT